METDMLKQMVKRIVVTVGLFMFLVSSLGPSVRAIGPVPRKAAELTITDSAGNPMQLASYKGKVMVVEFLLTNCPHCMRIAQMIGKLYGELKPRGLQAVGVAFDPNVNPQVVKAFSQQFAAGYPVGYVSSDKVDGYLGRGPTEKMRVPQIVVIDRKGLIRAQSLPTGEKNLEDETYLRNLLDRLLNESELPDDR
jgi:thiol-disulfide isomerase/thioredoxin